MSCLPFSRVNSLASARRAAIDAEIAELSTKATLLKAERNSLAPIAALPNELLVRVFAAFTAGTALSVRSPPALARLMLVCRHWSNIILAFPSLWAEITLWSLRWSRRSLAAQLSRAGVAPVKIYVQPLASYYTPIILANAARVKILDLGGRPRDLVDFIQAMQDVDFPTLCSLAFAAHDGDPTEPTVHFLPDLLGRMPSLCNLSLRGINIDTHWECLPPLRSLRLSAKPACPLNLIPLPTLLKFLQSSPDLRTLKLESMIHRGSVDSSLRVELPHLKLLHLSETLGTCEDLIDHLIFPASARLLLYPEYISTVEDTRHILVPIRNHLRAPTAPIATTLALISRIRNDINYLQTVTYPTTSTSSRTPENDALFAMHAVPSNIMALGEVLDKVLTAIPTHTITHLDATAAVLTANLWKIVFAALPGIQTARIDIAAEGKGFCDSVVVAGVTLRRLDILVLHLSEDEEVVSVEEFLDALMCMLRFWDGIGKRLARLHIDDYFDELKITGAREAKVKNLVDEFSRGEVAVYHNARFL
ncbi:hypothetical protein C8F04DRAFT_1013818 [Mycena alexandri]|uniref:F-box domain-containing protein n=1 Tax=Mycena alexandri TaxID=1745969 RepID=A0AAD6S434_9AGAR|nr:hypothetical protein C8F04DRAFT_1013818 [Mycena alexandri]